MINHEEYFKALINNGCPKCQSEDIEIQRRIEEQINYDEYWGIEDGKLQLNSQEDNSKEKRVIWYAVKCNECDYDLVSNMDTSLLVEVSNDWDNKEITETSFCKGVRNINV